MSDDKRAEPISDGDLKFWRFLSEDDAKHGETYSRIEPVAMLRLLDALAAETARADRAEAEVERWKAKQHYEWNQGDHNTVRAMQAEAERDAALAEVERLRDLNARQARMVEQYRKPVQEHCREYHIPALAERDAALAEVERITARGRDWFERCRQYRSERDTALAEIERLRAFHPIDQAMMQQALTERDAAVARAEAAEAKVEDHARLLCEALGDRYEPRNRDEWLRSFEEMLPHVKARSDMWRRLLKRIEEVDPEWLADLRAALADGTDPKDGAGQ